MVIQTKELSLVYLFPPCCLCLNFSALPVLMQSGKQKDPILSLAMRIACREVWFGPSALEIHGKGLQNTTGLYLYFFHVPVLPIQDCKEAEA